MPRLIVVCLILLALLTAFAQPGLCPCWLMAEVATQHPHPSGHPEQPHAHDYLSDLFSAQVIVSASLTFITAKILIETLETRKTYNLFTRVAATGRSWILLIEPPPPRLFNL